MSSKSRKQWFKAQSVMPVNEKPVFTADDMFWIKAELQKGRPFAIVLCELFYQKSPTYKQQIDEYSQKYWQEFTKGIPKAGT